VQAETIAGFVEIKVACWIHGLCRPMLAQPPDAKPYLIQGMAKALGFLQAALPS
jgi:hypothetical protein